MSYKSVVSLLENSAKPSAPVQYPTATRLPPNPIRTGKAEGNPATKSPTDYILTFPGVQWEHILQTCHHPWCCCRALNAASRAFWTGPSHLSRLSSLLPSKNPSFLGKPWVPSRKVSKPARKDQSRDMTKGCTLHITTTLKDASHSRDII